MTRVAVSGCLGFFNCRYDGEGFNNYDLEKAKSYLKKELNTDTIDWVPVCPEMLGGLSTPRIPSEIVEGTAVDVWKGTARVISKENKDVTGNFKRGAQEVLTYCKKFKVETVLLKESSPSCGTNLVYDGSFTVKKISGKGITSVLLEKNGIKVFPDTIAETNSLRQQV